MAQEMGAVGLVVINDQPGGRVFAMPGVIVEEEDAEGGISIPVIMVRWTIAVGCSPLIVNPKFDCVRFHSPGTRSIPPNRMVHTRNGVSTIRSSDAL